MIRARRGPTRLPKAGQPRDIHFRQGPPPPEQKGWLRRLFGCGLLLLVGLGVSALGLAGLVEFVTKAV